MKKADDDYNCNAFLCRGYQYEDNTDNVEAVKAGDVLVFHVDLVAGHRPGYAVSPKIQSDRTGEQQLLCTDIDVKNVSVVDLSTNTIIGEPLRTWAAWPDSESGPPRNDSKIGTYIEPLRWLTCR